MTPATAELIDGIDPIYGEAETGVRTDAVKASWVARRFGYERYAIENERGHQVALTHDAEYARLIAAAPDLLEALKDAVKLLERHYPIPAAKGEIFRARAAISKATGA